MHLNLPNISLNHLLVKQVMVSKISKLLVKTLSESRWYYVKPALSYTMDKEQEQEYTYSPISTYPPVRSLPLGGYDGVPFATVECRSVYSISLLYESSIAE
jgi:hypothetical protein